MANLIDTYQSNEEVRRVIRYAAVGTLGTAIDLGLFALLRVVLGAPLALSNTLSYGAGIVNNYFWHRYWTFSDRPRRAVSGQFLQFSIISLSALALNNLLVIWLSPPFTALIGSAKTGELLAKIGATGIAMFWNYSANYLWTFRAHREGDRL